MLQLLLLSGEAAPRDSTERQVAAAKTVTKVCFGSAIDAASWSTTSDALTSTHDIVDR